MILEIGAVAAAAALIQTARKGIPVKKGYLGELGTNSEIRWRARWGIWRWIAEVRSPETGWVEVGEYETREMAEAQAVAAAQSYLPATGTSFSDRPVNRGVKIR